MLNQILWYLELSNGRFDSHLSEGDRADEQAFGGQERVSGVGGNGPLTTELPQHNVSVDEEPQSLL